MSKNELQKLWGLDVDLPYREKVEKLQDMFADTLKSDVDINNGGNSVVYPESTKYNHYFSDGLYVREMFCVKGYLCFTVIHNTANPLFLMSGKVAFSSEDGVEELTAPTFILTKPGTKRICYWIEDSVIVTVHPNPDGLTDLEEIEKKMFACNWDQYNDDLKQDVWQMFEHKEYQRRIKEKNK
tara:strand:- start:912 stop:1460 length:549 start_codon:yes stop_codon:yes gene_type:complete